MKRIGIHTDLAVYQAVRYGNANVKEAEISGLREQLSDMEEKFADIN